MGKIGVISCEQPKGVSISRPTHTYQENAPMLFRLGSSSSGFNELPVQFVPYSADSLSPRAITGVESTERNHAAVCCGSAEAAFRLNEKNARSWYRLSCTHRSSDPSRSTANDDHVVLRIVRLGRWVEILAFRGSEAEITGKT